MHLKSPVFFIALLLLIGSCGDKKKQLVDTEDVTVTDFIDYFDEVKLPVHLADTVVAQPSPDSLRIGNKILSQFVPDSVFYPIFGKKTKTRVFPIGKATIKGAETYILVKAISGEKRAAFALVFQPDSFRAALPLVITTAKPAKNEMAQANLDSKFTFTTLDQKFNADGSMLYNKKVYIYNNEGLFNLILTESNDQSAARKKLQNPLDTLAATHKLSGDYWSGTRSLISLRDGRRAGTLRLFVHFEKENGACVGELKGEARITGNNSIQYTENDGPCVIDFKFSGTAVTMKELEGCGSYRDIKCFFEGRYVKKKKSTGSGAKKK